MIIHDTMPRPIETAATHTVDHMSRKEFNGFLYDLYGCNEGGVSNDVVAETSFWEDVSHVEVFNSPVGLIMAVHRGPAADDVHLIRPAKSKPRWRVKAQSVAMRATMDNNAAATENANAANWDASRAIEMLRNKLECTAHWRHEKSREYPKDSRNRDAVEELTGLAEQAHPDNIDAANLERYVDIYNDVDDERGLVHVEIENELLGGIGFGHFFSDANELVEEIIHEFEACTAGSEEGDWE